jgi:hypothetical protein
MRTFLMLLQVAQICAIVAAAAVAAGWLITEHDQ